MAKKVKRKKKNKSKLRLFIITNIIFVLLVFFAMSVYKDFIKISSNKNQIKSLTSKYNDLVDEKNALSSEVAKMQDPDYIARYAKEKYLYSSEGETILRED